VSIFFRCQLSHLACGPEPYSTPTMGLGHLLALVALLTARADGGEHRANVAVYLVGEPRTLNYTAPSLTKHVFQPLQSAGYNLTLFVQTYRCPTVKQYDLLAAASQYPTLITLAPHAPHAGDVSLECAKGLAPRLVTSIPGVLYARELLGRYHNRWQCDLRRREYEAAHGLRFQWIVWLRPDVVYFEPLPVAQLFHPAAVTVPDWHPSGGINDRFAALPRTLATDLFGLYPFLCAFNMSLIGQWVGNSEMLHKWYLDASDVRIRLLRNFHFLRLRKTIFTLRYNPKCPFTDFDMSTFRAHLPQIHAAVCRPAATSDWSVEACTRALVDACNPVRPAPVRVGARSGARRRGPLQPVAAFHQTRLPVPVVAARSHPRPTLPPRTKTEGKAPTHD